jgi:hypothetical protein
MPAAGAVDDSVRMSHHEDCDGLDRVAGHRPDRLGEDDPPATPRTTPRIPAPRRPRRPGLRRDILRDLRPDGVGVLDAFVRCPQCDDIASVAWRSSAAGAFGAVEHAKVHCIRGHWFLLPAAWLTPA